jgi:curved DNA-binding protein
MVTIMEFQDYYKILNVSRDASQKDIKRAYRKLARKYHPDVNKEKDAEERFKKIGEANEVLKNPGKRKLYDSYGKDWQQAGDHQQPHWSNRGPGQKPGQEDSSRAFHSGANDGFDDGSGFREYFENLFGGDSTGRRTYSDYGFDMPGQSHEAEITVSLADVYSGATKDLSFQTYESDSSGQVQPVTRTLRVKVPKGVTNGATIRLAGQGEKAVGQGTPGDLLLRVNIASDPRFRVKGHDLISVVAVSPWEAALGSKVPVYTLDGTVTLSIPKGSQNGRKLRLRGKGIPNRKGAQGDIIVELEIRIPDDITIEEEKIFKEMLQKSKFNPRDHHCQRAKEHV